MATSNDYLDPQDRSIGRQLLGVGVNLTGFLYGMSALEMVKEGAGRGYHVPWTKDTGEWPSKRIARFGRKKMHAWDDRVGVKMAKRPNQYAVNSLKKSAFTSYGKVEANLAKRYTRVLGAESAGIAARNATRYAAGSLVAGAAAGIGLAVLNWAMILPLAVDASKFVWEKATAPAERGSFMHLGGYFPETQSTFTSRQRAVQAITESQLQARSAIGNEAMLFHR